MSVGGASSTSFQPDQWNHIAVTSTSENNTCYLKLYINGSLVDSSQRFQTSCQVSLDQAKEYRIAKPPDGLGGISGYYFVGELDEVRFSDTVRYTGNFTRPSSPFGHDSHDLLLLKFDDRLGRVLDDSGYRIYMTAYGSHVAFVNSTIPSLPMPTTAVACESYSTCESCYSNLSCFYVFNYGGRNFCATNGSALAPIPGMCISAQTVGSRTCDQCRQQLTPTPTAPFMPIATPASLNVSTTNVIMELVKDLQSPSGLTLQNGFTITGAGASGWQLRNNQDATYTPPGGTASPTLGQGFGFYDSSGGITTGSSYTVCSKNPLYVDC
ncbi:hypothetical protein HYS11_00295 [Candidatus Gottesmanbacteria bacterium]|nr:hypothetical protein [Candidatus Gottesmanbacteria bacterium]